ncbi:MAG: thioredoxin-dependent thiol peroxidase [Alphaproteobacteria bacterium]|nr:thioredoxin-dependent thiol peroxidase [Alphaproteobacteria bacterium]
MTAAAKKIENPVVLNEGDAAPAFDMPTDKGGQVSLASLKGKNLVLYFYPKDDTPGCTVEAKDFRDLLPEFEKANTVIIGVSKDNVASHDKFKDKFCLPFQLASDEKTQTCEDYGVWVEKSMYGKKYFGIERTTFLIDGQGKIRNIWRKVKVDGHASDVLAAARQL